MSTIEGNCCCPCHTQFNAVEDVTAEVVMVHVLTVVSAEDVEEKRFRYQLEVTKWMSMLDEEPSKGDTVSPQFRHLLSLQIRRFQRSVLSAADLKAWLVDVMENPTVMPEVEMRLPME